MLQQLRPLAHPITLICALLLTVSITSWQGHVGRIISGCEIDEQIVTVEQVNKASAGMTRLIVRTNENQRFSLAVKPDATGVPTARFIPSEVYILDPGLLELVKSDDFGSYQLSQGVCASGFIKPNQFVKLQGANEFESKLAEIRSAIDAKLTGVLPLRSAALTAGLLVGNTANFAEADWDLFLDLGLTHAVAVSGANFSFVIGLFGLVTHRLPKRSKLIINSLFSLCYLAIVSFDNLPAVRAAMFLLILNFCSYSGIYIPRWQRILLAVTIIQVAWPWAHLNLGFQLSVIAWSVITIFMQGALDKIPLPEFFKTELLAALFGTVMLLPVTLFFFDSVNLISPVANLLASPFLALINLVGAVILLLPESVAGLVTNVTNLATQLVYLTLENLAHHSLVVETGSFLGHLIIALGAGTVVQKLISEWRKGGISQTLHI